MKTKPSVELSAFNGRCAKINNNVQSQKIIRKQKDNFSTTRGRVYMHVVVVLDLLFEFSDEAEEL